MTTENSEQFKKLEKTKFYKGLQTFLGNSTPQGKAQQKAALKLGSGLSSVMVLLIGIGSVVAFGVWGLVVIGIIVAANAGRGN